MREYSHRSLKEVNPHVFQNYNVESAALESGTADYLVVSYLGQAILGRGYVQAYKAQLPAEMVARGFIRATTNDRRFPPPSATESDREPHRVGEVWSGALWDLRVLLGCAASTPRCSAADRLVLDAWRSTPPQPTATIGPRFATNLVQKVRQADGEVRAAKMRAAFARRGLAI